MYNKDINKTEWKKLLSSKLLEIVRLEQKQLDLGDDIADRLYDELNIEQIQNVLAWEMEVIENLSKEHPTLAPLITKWKNGVVDRGNCFSSRVPTC